MFSRALLLFLLGLLELLALIMPESLLDLAPPSFLFIRACLIGTLVFIYCICREGKGFVPFSAIPLLVSFFLLPFGSTDFSEYLTCAYALSPVWAAELLLARASSKRFPGLHASQFGFFGNIGLCLLILFPIYVCYVVLNLAG